MSVYSGSPFSGGEDSHRLTSNTELPGPLTVAHEVRRKNGFIPRLDIVKVVPGLYEFVATHGGSEIIADAGFSSIREALETAADVT
jgi:hypothetical protein